MDGLAFGDLIPMLKNHIQQCMHGSFYIVIVLLKVNCVPMHVGVGKSGFVFKQPQIKFGTRCGSIP